MINWFDLIAIMLGAVFVTALWRLGFWAGLKSFLTFAVSATFSVFLTNPLVGLLEKLGWRENVFTPTLIFIFLLVVAWGILAVVGQNLWIKKPSISSRIAAIFLAVIYCAIFIGVIYQIIPTFVTAKAYDKIKDARTYVFLNLSLFDGSAKKLALGQNQLEPTDSLLIPRQSDEIYQINNLPAQGYLSSSLADQIFAKINESRMTIGRPALNRDEQLDRLAADYAQSILQTKRFSHLNINGQTPESRAKTQRINFNYLGENLAIAQTVEVAHRGLMDSPGHRANIEREIYRRVGVAVMDFGGKGVLVVEEFTN